PLRYLGVLGPRKRTEQLLAELGMSAGSLPEMLHTPMGLDLGGDGPEQVALAVLAEIQSVLGGRTGLSLRSRHAPIHSDEAGSEAETWVKSIVCA
ncbi:MAG: XdhC family protein, partial [Acidobacteriaceae bacterium]|nr:XdhC family protein [Acidobacteriaceae bacterium]